VYEKLRTRTDADRISTDLYFGTHEDERTVLYTTKSPDDKKRIPTIKPRRSVNAKRTTRPLQKY